MVNTQTDGGCVYSVVTVGRDGRTYETYRIHDLNEALHLLTVRGRGKVIAYHLDLGTLTETAEVVKVSE